MRLALDQHYSRIIADRLRADGHDAVAAVERGWDQMEDEPLLELCRSEQRALLTNNVSGFTAIARRWAVQGQPHGGLIFTSDANLPRSKATIGRYVQLLNDLLAQHEGPDGFTDRVHWL